MAEFGAKADHSDFEFNALQLLERERAQPTRFAILTALVGVYDKAFEERVKREAMVNEWVGQAGQRRDFEAVFSGCHSFDTDYGWMCIARFYTPEGLLVYKGATVWWEAKEGDTVKFKASIKAHADWKGQKQTLILRAKQLGAAIAAPAAEENACA
jgi:hypothetical protein